MANKKIMSNWLADSRKPCVTVTLWPTRQNCRTSESLEDSPTLPAAQTSWQLPSSPRPRDIKSGGWWVEEEERKLWEVEVSGSFNVLLVSRTTASWTLLSGPRSAHLIWTDHFFKWFVLWSFLLAHFNFQLPLCRLSLICWRGLLDTDRTVAIK